MKLFLLLIAFENSSYTRSAKKKRKTRFALIIRLNVGIRNDFLNRELTYDTLTEHFTISEPQNQAINEFCVVRECRSPDYEALKLWKVLQETVAQNCS